MKKERLVNFIVFGMVVCLFVSLFVNYKQYRDALEKPDKVKIVTDTVYTERTDNHSEHNKVH